MSASFDIAAQQYDAQFTNTAIGRLQRDRVWAYLNKTLPENTTLKILELNCGTGEDAIFLARKGHDVMASDVSAQMLQIANFKTEKEQLNIQFQKIDLTQIQQINFSEPFDFIFSNFGGLNCLNENELLGLSGHLTKVLKPEGKFIAVIMPKFCFIESLYFLSKLQFKKAWRRLNNEFVNVNVDGVQVKTFYYQPSTFYKIFKSNFSLNKKEKVGFIPSYLENVIQKSNFIKQLLFGMDHALATFNLVSCTDHYLMELQRKGS